MRLISYLKDGHDQLALLVNNLAYDADMVHPILHGIFAAIDGRGIVLGADQFDLDLAPIGNGDGKHGLGRLAPIFHVAQPHILEQEERADTHGFSPVFQFGVEILGQKGDLDDVAQRFDRSGVGPRVGYGHSRSFQAKRLSGASISPLRVARKAAPAAPSIAR